MTARFVKGLAVGLGLFVPVVAIGAIAPWALAVLGFVVVLAIVGDTILDVYSADAEDEGDMFDGFICEDPLCECEYKGA